MKLLWSASDGWADLKSEVEELNEITTVTENGTRHFFCLVDQHHMRMPGSLIYNPLEHDNSWVQYRNMIELSPCGFYLTNGFAVRASSRMVLLYDGLVPEPPTAEFKANVEYVSKIDSHPEDPCQAYYCLKKAMYNWSSPT